VRVLHGSFIQLIPPYKTIWQHCGGLLALGDLLMHTGEFLLAR
jgi:hypothetical protein